MGKDEGVGRSETDQCSPTHQTLPWHRYVGVNNLDSSAELELQVGVAEGTSSNSPKRARQPCRHNS